MLVIVDAEVIFAALIRRGYTLNLIRLLHERGYELVVPEYIFEEVGRREDKLLKYSRLEKGKLWYTLFLALKKIKPVSVEEYSGYIGDARKFSPPEDFPYAALALKYRSLNREVKIWSNDPEFRDALIGKIEVLSTKEVKKLLGLI